MGDVLVVKFRKAKKRRRAPGLAMTYGATADGRIMLAASGKRFFTVEELTSLIRDLRDVRDDAKARVKPSSPREAT
jgi:hypothetical protein